MGFLMPELDFPARDFRPDFLNRVVRFPVMVVDRRAFELQLGLDKSGGGQEEGWYG